MAHSKSSSPVLPIALVAEPIPIAFREFALQELSLIFGELNVRLTGFNFDVASNPESEKMIEVRYKNKLFYMMLDVCLKKQTSSTLDEQDLKISMCMRFANPDDLPSAIKDIVTTCEATNNNRFNLIPYCNKYSIMPLHPSYTPCQMISEIAMMTNKAFIQALFEKARVTPSQVINWFKSYILQNVDSPVTYSGSCTDR